MHSILIVDDDVMIVRGLEQLVDWQAMGFRIVGTARDGEEGIEAIRRLQPEVVLTDIKMPYKDGLAMIEDCHRDGLSPYFVVLTGFNEFEYARRALKSRVSDYLLKPVEENELIAVMNGIHAQIVDARKNQAAMSALQSAAQESYSLVREKLIGDLVTGASPVPPDAGKLGYYNIRLGDGSCHVALLEGEAELLDSDKLLEMISAVFERRGVRSYMSRGEGIVTLLLADAGGRQISDGLDEISAKAKAWLGLVLTIGVSEAGDAFGLPELYRQAELALQHRLYRGRGAVIAYGTIGASRPESGSGLPAPLPEEQARRLLAAVSENNEAGVLAELDAFFRELRRQGGLSRHAVYSACEELLYEVRKALGEIGFPEDKLADIPTASAADLRQYGTLDELRQQFETMLRQLRTSLDRSGEFPGSEQLNGILLYMNTRYAERIDLDVISKTFYIDPSYFCKLFKKTMGETYLQYLTRIRIEKACRLLGNPTVKVYEVCGKVGYEDQRYFSQVFRKHTGMTPSDYQRTKTKN